MCSLIIIHNTFIQFLFYMRDACNSTSHITLEENLNFVTKCHEREERDKKIFKFHVT